MAGLPLVNVTLAAATSVNLAATIAALQESSRTVEFGEVLLLTDADVEAPAPIRVRRIGSLRSIQDYCRFMLTQLGDFIQTEHVLVCQWDGFVLNSSAWDPSFLDYDYVGAPWPQFSDGLNVGNGGFSLRSRRLLEALRQPDIVISSPEDVAIGRLNRRRLEADHGVRFADQATAARFSFERSAGSPGTFGFHGAFNLIPLLGADRFWSIYRTLDERGAVLRDAHLIRQQLSGTPDSGKRQLRLAVDQLLGYLR
jgi:hypothetical protein